MIPKIIHYCWFGGKPLNKMARKCINSWKKYCPDYKIIEWNESNFDINLLEYTKQAYEKKKWAFVSDVARLYALSSFGGIYFDTDVELVKSPDELLSLETVFGFENNTSIATSVMMSCQNAPILHELYSEYLSEKFILPDGSTNEKTNVTRLSNHLYRKGLVFNGKYQEINGVIIFPKEYFSPKDMVCNKVTFTNNTIAIHYFSSSWSPWYSKLNIIVYRALCSIGLSCFAKELQKVLNK